MSGPTSMQNVRLGLLALFCLVTLGAGIAEYQLFAHLEQETKTSAFKELFSIGQLKAGQLAAFLKERRGDSLVLTDLLQIGLTQGWWAAKDKDLPAALQQPLRSAVTYYDYAGAMILDTKGNVRFRTGHSMNLSETGKSFVRQVVKTAPPPFSKLYLADPATPEQQMLDTFAPIKGADKTTTVGVLVLRGDWPGLFTMIQSWPVESRTAETLLVRHDKTHVTVINEPRDRTQTVLKPFMPFSIVADAQPWPIVKAAQGQYEALETSDYRGQTVLAYILPVQDTHLNMVVKVDTQEVLGHLRLLQSITAVGTLFVAVGLGLWAHSWQRRREQTSARREAQHVEHRLAAVIDSAMDAIISLDEDQRIVLFNPTAERLFGCTAQKALGQPIDRFILPQFPEAHREHIRAFGLSNKTTRKMGTLGTISGLRSNGQEFPLEASISQTQTDGDTLYTVILRDITEHQRAKETLLRNEERLREAQHLAQIGSWELDHMTSTLTWSDEIFRIFEVDPAQFGPSSETFINTVHPDDRDLANKAYRTSLETRKPYKIVHRLLMGDGRIKFVQAHYETYYDEASGQPLRSTGTVQDLTALKKAELALTQSESLFRALATMAPVGIFRTDAAGQCTYVNEPYCEISGRAPEAALGSGWAVALHPEDRARVFEDWQHAVQKRIPFESELRMQRPNGQTAWIVARARAETGSGGEVTGYIGTITDISERKQNELRIEASLREKETLLREVHHRVKNNLQIISSLLHFQAKKAQPGHELTIFTEGQNRLRAMILVHELLYRSTDLHRISLAEYLKTLTDQLRQSFREATSRIQLLVEADDLSVPAAIALPCGMIVTELVTNAYKYAYPAGTSGPVLVRIATGERSFLLSVSDEGFGLPAEFDLAQAGSFGLQLVANLAAQLGATLTRPPRIGTEIVLEVPLPSRAGATDRTMTYSRSATPPI